MGKEAPVLIGSDTKVSDAAGKVLAPGFIDGHTHLSWLFSIPEFVRFAASAGLKQFSIFVHRELPIHTNKQPRAGYTP